MFIAETLLAVERIAGSALRSTPSALPAFGGSNVAARVRSLLDEPPPEPSLRLAAWSTAVGVAAALWLAADPLHHLTEHWLRLVLSLG